MSVQPAALELLSALTNVLPRWGRWYVFGAQAVIAYGVPRLSADVDVTLQLVPDNPEAFARDTVPFLHPEDLVIAKVLAGRPKDIEDAPNLWRLHGRELNADRIVAVLGQLDEALSQSDLVAAFESIVAGASRT